MDVPAYRERHQLKDQKRAAVTVNFMVDEMRPWLPVASQASYRLSCPS